MTEQAKRPELDAIVPNSWHKRTPRVLIVEGRFYDDVADALLDGATAELQASGIAFECITVPGALEIPQVLGHAIEAGVIPASAPNARFAGFVALGCVIRGETAHYDIVCNNANHWMMELATHHRVSVGNGILTVDTKQQALARAEGGRKGKGADAARACLRLLNIAHDFQEMSA